MARQDSVQKIFGKTVREMFADRSTDPKPLRNATFWEDSGPEELRHLEDILSKLSENDVREIAKAVGIKSWDEGYVDRDTLASWLDEVGREDFYSVYNRITKRKFNK